MKKYLCLVVMLSCVLCYSQRKVNYNFTANFTFTQNKHFGEYDESLEKTDWFPLAFKSILLRNGFDVELNKTITLGANLGLDWHPDIDVLAIPYYLETKFNLFKSDDNAFYVGAGVGKLLRLTDAFERGDYYKVGIGYHISATDTQSFVFNIDFHQKRIAELENGRLNSFSIGFGMLFL